jgi:CelD/BcsL family acetyltransferase involved in cellulose biosynthesis
VGRFLNDAQNVIGLPSNQVDWVALMRACDVVAFDFHAIIHPASSWIDTYQLQSVGAFQADFVGDSPGYLRQLEKDHRTIGKQGQKTRKLHREIGPVRLEIDCRCPEVLARTIAWKRDQYQRTHILDLFLPDWTRRLVEVLYDDDHASPSPLTADGRPSDSLQNESLRGLLSVLWAGDTVVAAHFGMVERGRLHYWFPTYDPEYARYSPGTALFTELVRASTGHGIDCIDMGYGEQPYKQKQTATATQVAFGTITHSRWHRFSYHTQRRLVDCLKRMPMKQTVKRAWRAVHPTAGINKLG